jgi:hypothetical protein
MAGVDRCSHRSRSRNRKRWIAKLAAMLVGCFLSFLILECYVRWFDPFPILLRGGQIDLPIRSKLTFSSQGVPGLDPTIHVSYNSLGFRGPEPPTNWSETETMICVGGSTTQCIYLSNGTTWPDQLALKFSESGKPLWINNAGIDGHSTFGHLQLLKQYVLPLRPRSIMFLVGLNDVDRVDLGESDATTLRGLGKEDDTLLRSVQRWMLRNSSAFALSDNFRLHWMARRKGLTHGAMGHGSLPASTSVQRMSDIARQQWIADRDPNCLTDYENRLHQLIDLCQKEDIKCFFATQPVLYGVGVDEATGLDLEAVRVGEVDGWTHWQLLRKYNETTLNVARERGVPCVDLAAELPKSSLYFYDLTHYNKMGAEKVAQIVFDALIKERL